jgi:uncharacterized protein
MPESTVAEASAPTGYRPRPGTTPTRLRERARYDRETVHAVLDEGYFCHLGFVVDGAPVVLPTIHARVGETLYLHGSSGSRPLRMGASGMPVCVTVTLLDGLVLARSAFHHSMNYRSVVVHGQAELVRDPEEMRTALNALVEHVMPGRWADCRPPSVKELAATSVLRLPLTEVSAKVRAGDAADEDEDLALEHWAGVVPISLVRGEPRPAADLAAATSLPDYLSG